MKKSLYCSLAGLCVAAFAFVALPASAMQIDDGYRYQFVQDVFYIPIVDADITYFVADENALQSSARSPGGGTSFKSTEPMAPIPVYALSLKTNGQSLAGYHRRC